MFTAGEREPLTVRRYGAEWIAVADGPELPRAGDVPDALRVEWSRREHQCRRGEEPEARDAGSHATPLAALFQEVERVLQPRHGGIERRLADEMQLPQELQRVSQVL